MVRLYSFVVLCALLLTTALGCQSSTTEITDIGESYEYTADLSPTNVDYLMPPARPITYGPDYHWFGYYDKLQFDPTGRYALGMAVNFEDRSPGPDNSITIGMVDLEADSAAWIPLGTSHAWNWQMGCMLQWVPGTESTIIWNDREGAHFVARIMDVKTGATRTIPHPIFCLAPDGKTALSTDFTRIQHMRPGYGYAGLPDPNKDVNTPEDAGIYSVDLASGERTLIISYADAAAIPWPHGNISDSKHYFNVLIVNPDGTRFLVLDRWRIAYSETNPDTPFGTRLLTANMDGTDIRVIDDSGYTSHLIWRDPSHILAWSKQPSHGDRFYLFSDEDPPVITPVAPDVMTVNGHCSYLPNRDWILCDTYPDENRYQHVYLYYVPTGEKHTLGYFYSPPKYRFDTEIRVDTHPRHSRDGRLICIDSVHGGAGRQLYVMDVSEIIGAE